MSFKKIYRGNTQPETYLNTGRNPENPTIRVSHDPMFRPANGLVEFDAERIDSVVMALVNLKAEIEEGNAKKANSSDSGREVAMPVSNDPKGANDAE